MQLLTRTHRSNAHLTAAGLQAEGVRRSIAVGIVSEIESPRSVGSKCRKYPIGAAQCHAISETSRVVPDLEPAYRSRRIDSNVARIAYDSHPLLFRTASP